MSSSDSESSSSDVVPLKRKRDQEDDAAPEDDDQPVLSHAEKRRQRKKEKSSAREGGKEVKKKRKTKDTSEQTILNNTGSDAAVHPGKEKRQNSVWVGNLSFKTGIDDIKRFFADVGEPTRIHMPTKAPAHAGSKPENRGFAYVDFATPELKDAAIAKSEQPLLGRSLLIKDGSNFEGRPVTAVENTEKSKGTTTLSKTAQGILKAQKQPPCPTLFLGNLGFNTTEASILELFNAHRKKPLSEKADEDGEEKKDNWIRKVRMGTFEDSGLCKGFAFVDFTTIEHATSVLINPRNHRLDGRKLVVEYASPDAVRRGGGPRPKGSVNERSKGEKQVSKEENKKRKHEETERDTQADYEQGDEKEDGSTRPKKSFKGERSYTQKTQGRSGSRPKPGAALALAKRESAAIVPGAGKKIVF